MSKPQTRRTIPLTKAQIQTAAGAELLALCQTVTGDGTIQDEEVAALRSWLDENRSRDLPSIEFLVQTVEKILADGRVDDWERRDLHKALERVLPPDSRRAASAARKDVEHREFVAQEEFVARESSNDPRAWRDAERVGDVYDFMVAGVSYEGRGDIVDAYVHDAMLVYFFRDRANQHSRNAVEIRLQNGLMIGFVPEEFAQEMAPLLDAGHPYHAWVKKILGYNFSVPVILAEVLRKDVRLPFAMREGQLPEPEDGGSRTAKVLRGAAPEGVHTQNLIKTMPALLRADLEALNGREVELDHMEQYVAHCGEIVPAVREFLGRSGIERSTRDELVARTEKAVRDALRQLRPALAQSLPNAAPPEAERVVRLIQAVDASAATEVNRPSAVDTIPIISEPQPVRSRTQVAHAVNASAAPQITRPSASHTMPTLMLIVGVMTVAAIIFAVFLAAGRS